MAVWVAADEAGVADKTDTVHEGDTVNEAGVADGTTGAEVAAGRAAGATSVDTDAVDAVLTASRSLVAVVTRSLGAAAQDTTLAQYRTLVVLASRGPQRLVDLATTLDVAPSTAGRMCDRLVRKGLIRRNRARADRRAVLVSITAAGRQVVDAETAQRRALIAGILSELAPERRLAVAQAMREFADAAGEIPDSQWPAGEAEGQRAAKDADGPRPAGEPGGQRAAGDADGPRPAGEREGR